MKVLVSILVSLFIIGCSHDSHKGVIPSLSSTMMSKSGSNISGDLEFTQKKNGVELVVSLDGLAPNSKHGFHIHAIGDCSSADGKSAGGHFNPEGHNHGAPHLSSHHLGDLGNLRANSKGQGQKTIFIERAVLGGTSKLSILNRAVIVHKKMDDMSSQPSGNAGPRIGCAVISPKTN